MPRNKTRGTSVTPAFCFSLDPGMTRGELVIGKAYNVERVYDLGGFCNDLASGGGIALEAVHADDFDVIAELLALIIQPCSQRVSACCWDNVKKPGGADDVCILVVVVGHIDDDGDVSVARAWPPESGHVGG